MWTPGGLWACSPARLSSGRGRRRDYRSLPGSPDEHGGGGLSSPPAQLSFTAVFSALSLPRLRKDMALRSSFPSGWGLEDMGMPYRKLDRTELLDEDGTAAAATATAAAAALTGTCALALWLTSVVLASRGRSSAGLEAGSGDRLSAGVASCSWTAGAGGAAAGSPGDGELDAVALLQDLHQRLGVVLAGLPQGHALGQPVGHHAAGLLQDGVVRHRQQAAPAQRLTCTRTQAPQSQAGVGGALRRAGGGGRVRLCSYCTEQ